MKLKFESNLEYQTKAIDAVANLFKGQNPMISNFMVSGQVDLDSNYGIGNKLLISHDDILKNLNEVQIANQIAPSEDLDTLDFNIEMETGTGKTYVYLKTIFELNKKYNFNKFIIVVPSIAIKEGVYKNIEITKEHFKNLYGNKPFDYFVYDSSKLEQVMSFALSSHIQIMIINIDSFNRSFKDPSKETKANIFHRNSEKLSGYSPKDYIQKTRPIVIIDEPQSVVNTDNAKEALESLNSLCTLRYSATHKEIQNLVYKLDAVDAYEQNLVKRIEVASVKSINQHNDAYLRLVSVSNKNNSITAKIEVDADVKGDIKRKIITVKQGDDLSERKLTNRDIYKGYTIDEIYSEKGNEYVAFTQKEDILRINDVVGDIDDKSIKRAQISKTIEEHLNKELRYNNKGIKVLSLFFIDKVANYRQYDENGNPLKGPYALMFEEEYSKLIKRPKYSELTKYTAEEVHNGYFSKDGKGRVKDSRENKRGELRANKADESTFNLIMKEKEKLLSFDSPLKFIFSHSALREGWDNPNVFQICTLNETKSSMKKRQEIGRGLRLCVNQDGERIKNKDINTLTIMANESYEEFAKSLQTEIENDTGIKFGIINKHDFSHIVWEKDGKKVNIGNYLSNKIYKDLILKKYINRQGKIQDSLRVALKEETVEIPEEFKSIESEIIAVLKKHRKPPAVVNKDNRVPVKVNKRVFLSPDFKDFWDRIKHKTTYAVEFDTDELIYNCSEAIDEELNISAPKLIYTKSGLIIDADGVYVDEEGKIPPSQVYTEEQEIELPDILTILQNETYLTRRTLKDILVESNTLEEFKKNPQDYITEVLKIIKREMSHMLIDGIKYTEINDYYEQGLFEEEELWGYIDSNAFETNRSVYDHVIYDSDYEKEFAEDLERDPDVILYTKLPGWFKIDTPLGGYNPDWAILLKDEDNNKKLYFVVETKRNANPDAIRPTEKDKIRCGRKHFKALDQSVEFEAIDDYTKFKVNLK